MRHLLDHRSERMMLSFWWVASNHLRHLFNLQTVAMYLLDILQSRNYFTLDKEVDSNLVLDAFLDAKRLLL